MIRLIFTVALFLLCAPAIAQERGGPAPAPHAAERQVDPAPQQENVAPVLTAMTGGCARPGGIFSLEGARLLQNRDLTPSIKQDEKFLPLEILSRTDKNFIVRFPEDSTVLPDRNYKIVLVERNKDVGPSLTVRSCPQVTAKNEAPLPQREILIMADSGQGAAIAAWLDSAKIAVASRENLPALQSVIFTLPGNEALLQTLRGAFPEAAIDWNDDLDGAKGPRLYARDKIGWPQGQSCLPQKGKLKIGLIDGAIDKKHAALKGQDIQAKNFLGNGRADYAHATALASILVGNAPEEGFDGLLKGQPIYSAVALRAAEPDKSLAATKAVIGALDWLLGNKVRLINVSLTTSKNNMVLSRGFEAAFDRGALIFAAAGNNGPQAPPVYPAAYSRAIAVTAIDAAGRLYKQANSGDYIDFAAPGVDIWVAAGQGGAYKSGTSYAVPHILAAAALALSENGSMPRDLVTEILKQNAISDADAFVLLKNAEKLCK